MGGVTGYKQPLVITIILRTVRSLIGRMQRHGI